MIIAIASPGVIVTATEEGPDGPVPTTKTIGATVSPSNPSLAAVLDALRRGKITFFAVQLDTYQARGADQTPPEVQYSWPTEAPIQTGGRTDRLQTAQGLAGVLERIADELLGQYAVTYRSPDAPANSPVPPTTVAT